ncbi:ABC transporter ATP-binding protein [Acholeplasma sp. OttesenSCG-928-E16]|nr:ABC transporter ATP-binding protein [Acholeplasma sp. OttesenSCG-928-E16]
MEPLKKLEIINISKIYDTNEAVSNVSFDIYDGEFLSILGPSGCGKTTLLRMLIGLIQPTSGKIIKDGRDITNASPSSRKMGIVFQNYALFENMSVLKNVEYSLKIKQPKEEDIDEAKKLSSNGKPTRFRIKAERNKRARKVATDLLKKLGLEEHMNKKPTALSGGQQQRVAIARTLALNPEIILFDEPMSALDVETRLSLRQELKKIQNEFKTTMIYITHDQEEAFAMSDRIMVMEKAVTSQIGTPEEIIANPANEYVKTFVIKNLQIKIDSLKRFMGSKNED